MATRSAQTNTKADFKLAVGVAILWSFGRIIGSLQYLGVQGASGMQTLFLSSMLFYVLMHLVVFGFCARLLYDAFQAKRKNVWEIALYIYVLLAIAASLLFIAYQFGYVPTFLENMFSSQAAWGL